jgi:hypothetical protein
MHLCHVDVGRGRRGGGGGGGGDHWEPEERRNNGEVRPRLSVI